MKDKKNIVYLIIAIILFIGTLAFCLKVYFFDNDNNKKEDNIEISEVSKTKDIDNISYKDIVFYRADGSEVKLSDYQNSPIVLLFFDKTSEDSIEELNRVENMYNNYKDKINFFMINCAQEVDEELQSKYTLEIFYDFYKGATRNYNISEFPSIIYINKENVVFNAKSGLTTTDALEANLDILSDNI